MKKTNYILSLLVLFLLSGCNSEDDNITTEKNILYLKSKKNTNPDFSYLNEYYVFENGLLINASGYTTFDGTYSYNNDSNLIEKESVSGNYAYEYDNQDRVIKELNVDTNNYYELVYSSDKVLINEFYNGNLTPFSEITINSNGKIIKVRQLVDTTSYTFMVQEYSYDNSGNIIRLIYKENNKGDADVDVNYQYDENKNPYYYSLKNLYKNIYYLECRSGIPNYIDRGLTPNNMTVYGSTSYSYEYNSEDYPISYTKSNGNVYLYEYQ